MVPSRFTFKPLFEWNTAKNRITPGSWTHKNKENQLHYQWPWISSWPLLWTGTRDLSPKGFGLPSRCCHNSAARCRRCSGIWRGSRWHIAYCLERGPGSYAFWWGRRWRRTCRWELNLRCWACGREVGPRRADMWGQPLESTAGDRRPSSGTALGSTARWAPWFSPWKWYPLAAWSLALSPWSIWYSKLSSSSIAYPMNGIGKWERVCLLIHKVSPHSSAGLQWYWPLPL